MIIKERHIDKSDSPFTYQKLSQFHPPCFAHKSRTIKSCSKQYITVDNTHQLLYTVYHKGENKNMHIILNHSSMVPIYEQLMEQIKSEIIQSVLKEGEALPSVRTLAGELRISALTVKKAYDKLEEEGFVTTVHGKGTYVTASDKQLASEARRIAVEEDFDKAIDRAVAIGMEKEEILEVVKLILDEK